MHGKSCSVDFGAFAPEVSLSAHGSRTMQQPQFANVLLFCDLSVHDALCSRNSQIPADCGPASCRACSCAAL